MVHKLTVLASLIAVSACMPVPVDHRPAVAPIGIKSTVEARTVQLAKLVMDIRRGERIGVFRSGWGCVRQAPLVWNGAASFLNDKDVIRTFNEEFGKADYPVVGDPNVLIPDKDLRPDLLVAARITELRANYCHPDHDDESRGDTSVSVEWQLYDANSLRAVYKTTTHGSSQLDEIVAGGRHILFYNALAEATRALLADQGFHAIVATSPKDDAPRSTEASFRLHPRPLLGGTIANVPDLQAATVTILSGGGHGSGFFVSSAGFLLTNAHVVGNAKFVRVRLSSGREIAGDVIVVSRHRDVALVKVAEAGLTALAISPTEPRIGTDIYAVGTPLYLKYATSVTKGIVSGYRLTDIGRLIQGDVDIHGGNSGGPLVDGSGNVVGITVSGVMANEKKMSVGLNFFIPIAEALKAVGIELGDVRADSAMRVLDRPVAAALQPGGPRPIPKPVTEAATPVAPAEPPPSAPAPQAPKVASLDPVAVPAKRDGEYRTRFTASTISGRSSVDLAITIDGERIVGAGRTRGGLQCRADGEIARDGAAWINVACSNTGGAYLSWQLAGTFTVEQDTGYVGRLSYANLNGDRGTAVFRPY